MIDLHMHTNHSDGTDSVQELLEKAESKKIEIISITDHDTVGAYYELEAYPEIRKKYSGEIIIGSEIKTYYKETNIEILAYGIDYKRIKIKTMRNENQEKIQTDILKHHIKVAKELGIKVNENIKIDQTNPDKMYAGLVFCSDIIKHNENEQILKDLLNIDITKTMHRINFYEKHESNKNSPFFYDTTKYSDDYQTVIDKIHNAGGLAFLAHGFEYGFEDNRKVLEEMARTTNIDGFECIYPLFSSEEREFMIDMCKKYNKYTSGGSDYHADHKPTTFMGTGIDNNILIPKEFVESWIKKVKKI